MMKSQIPNPKSQANPKSQIQNYKPKTLLFVICALILFCHLCFGIFHLYAQENLGALKDKYFSEHNYSAFVEYLKAIKPKEPSQQAKVSYYIALSRYDQLKYLEESQGWDEYFSSGNDYRDELAKEASNAIALTVADSLNLYARCLFWQFHKDQEDIFAQDALNSLLDGVDQYAGKQEDLGPIKYIADKLYSYGQRSEAKKIYNIYVEKLLKTETKVEKLKEVAQEAWAQGNIPLAGVIYDAYIDRIIKSYPKEKTLGPLISIAQDFLYKDEGESDPEYAEKIFQKIDQIGGPDVLDEGTSYARAYNLEKSRVFADAKDRYMALIQKFPQSPHYAEALFKSAIITTYVLRDIEQGVTLFERLAASPEVNPQVISGIYQLGLLSQWKQDLPKAKEYYTKLKELAADKFGDTVALAGQRLKELEDGAEMVYNLKTFLDASLKDNFDMTKIDLIARPYKINKDKETSVKSDVALPESGCMSVEVNYLWSGHLGSANPTINQSEFATSHAYTGTKEVNLVVVTASGILDRSIEMVDVE
jgi:TolA-binding protein